MEKNWSLIQICHEKGGDFGYGAHFSCGWPNQALEEALRQTDKEISELELKEQSPGRKSDWENVGQPTDVRYEI